MLACICNSPQIPMVLGDANRVGQILTNLVGNGIKFTETGSVLLQLEWRPADENSAELEFSVTDTGIGIPEQQRDRIFEKFYRVDTKVGRRRGRHRAGIKYLAIAGKRHGRDAGIHCAGMRRFLLCAEASPASRSRLPCRRAWPLAEPLCWSRRTQGSNF